ncbi:MAG: acyl-CoA dehydrogenase family protein [Reyranellaceae bacterium]
MPLGTGEDAPASSFAAFRAEVRTFLKDNLSPEMARRNRSAVHPSRDDTLAWTAILAKRGWSVPGWPVEHGGTGWSARQRLVLEEELLRAGAPITNIQGVSLVGPVICAFGTAEQQRRYLPGIREGRSFWAQGFSEPNSGSDLASLRTRAVRDGGHWVINGQKIWTSQAMLADMIFCLVRTEPEAKPQLGISFLLVPLDSKGITVRPIPSIDEGESLCEVFFDDVRVPADALVGEPGRGWDYAKFLLGNERIATAEVPRNKRNLAVLKEMAAAAPDGAGKLIDNPDFRRRIAELEIELATLEAGVERALDGDDDALLPSVLKLAGCALLQSILQLQVESLGVYGAVYNVQAEDGPAGVSATAAGVGPAEAVDVTAEFLFRRAATIYGGSNEVQKNIVARTLLRTQHRARSLLSEEQQMLRDSAAGWLGRTYGFDARKMMLADRATAFAANWKAFAEMGWLGTALAEEHGGLGGSLSDTAVLAEEFGRALVLEPFGPATLAGRLLERAVPPPQRPALLAPLVSGETLTVLAHDEPGARGRLSAVATTATPTDGGYRLHGRKCVVLGGDQAQRFVVSARTAGGPLDPAGISLFVVERDAPGLVATPCRLIDGRGAAELDLRGVEVGADAILGAPGEGLAALGPALDEATMLACADAVGAMDQALWITCDYLKVRKQFGTLLADFQVLQHRLAEMYVELEKARSSLRQGVRALASSDPAARRRAVSAAKAQIGRSGFFVGSQAIQLHGGIGMTEAYAVGHYFKRLCTFDMLLGNAAHHTALIAGEL